MPHRSKRAVRIANPASGPGWTSQRRAAEYVRQGRARWMPGGIEFLPGNARHRTVARIVAEDDYSRAAHSGFATLDALRNLPMVGRLELMLTESSRRRP